MLAKSPLSMLEFEYNFNIRLLIITANTVLKTFYILNFIYQDVVGLCLVSPFINIGIQVPVGLNVGKLMFLFVNEDNVCVNIFCNLIPMGLKARCLISLNDSHSHFNVIYRPVSASSSSALYHFHNVKAFFNLAKDSILTVKMGSAANSGVYLQLVIG